MSDLLRRYKEDLLRSIPVVSAMEVDVSDVDDNFVKVSAPLNTNINYEGTAFGGSLNTMCILSCYLMAHHLMKINEIPFQSLVIQNSSIQYKKPVQKDFSATARVDEKEARKFVKMLNRKGMGRIEVKSQISTADGEALVEFTGRFVATL